MVTLVVIPTEGKEERSRAFASNGKDYQEYIDYLENKYDLQSVEKGIVIDGTNKVRTGVFDKMPVEIREMTNFNQFTKVARRKRF